MTDDSLDSKSWDTINAPRILDPSSTARLIIAVCHSSTLRRLRARRSHLSSSSTAAASLPSSSTSYRPLSPSPFHPNRLPPHFPPCRSSSPARTSAATPQPLCGPRVLNPPSSPMSTPSGPSNPSTPAPIARTLSSQLTRAISPSRRWRSTAIFTHSAPVSYFPTFAPDCPD